MLTDTRQLPGVESADAIMPDSDDDELRRMCVARLNQYVDVDQVLDAVRRLPGIEEAEPSERLVLWLVEDDEPGSRVELRLIAVPYGTRVTVTEAPVGPFALAGA